MGIVILKPSVITITKILFVYNGVFIYIYKEELKTVVREFLACTQPNRHETSTALWNSYRRVSLRGRRAQIRFSLGARGEKPENERPPFWFYGESIRNSVFNSTSVHGLHGNGAAMPKRRRVLSRTTRDAKRKKATRSEEDSAQQMQASYMYNCKCCYSEYPCNSS